MTALLGDDIVWFVHEAECGAYRAAGAAVVVGCEISGSMARIRNAILDRFLEDNEAVAMCDDDLRAVRALTRRKTRVYRDRKSIRSIIENMVNLVLDSGAEMGGWNRNAVPMQYSPHDPFHLVGPMAGAFVVTRKTARADERLRKCEDVDMTLATIMKARFVIADLRFYFDFGPSWSGVGGNSGVLMAGEEDEDRRLMRQKWGRYLRYGKSGNVARKKTSVPAMSLRVERKSALTEYA